MEQLPSRLDAFSRLAQNQIVQRIPEDISICEFDCRRTQCTDQQWTSCDRRLDRAAGELMPAPTAAV